MGSIHKTQLDELYASLFGWLTREITAFMFISVAMLMLTLGLLFAILRPRGIGAMLVVVHGLIGAVFAAVWHHAPMLEFRRYWWALGLTILYTAISATLVFWAGQKPTAKECGVSASLKNIATVYVFFIVALGLEAYYVSNYSELTGAPDDWYVLKFVRAFALTSGTLLMAVCAITAFVKRLRAKPPYKPIELP